MRTCVYCGRAYPDDIQVCPACGLNLGDTQANAFGQIEIDLEPEEWTPPSQQTAPVQQTPPRQQAAPVQQTPPRQQAAPVQQTPPGAAAQIPASPELMKLYGRNRIYYLCRYLLGLALCLLGFNSRQNETMWIAIWENLTHPNSSLVPRLERGDYFLIGLFLAALIGGIYECAKLAKPPLELLRDAQQSQEAYIQLFGITDRWRILYKKSSQSSLANLAIWFLGFFSIVLTLELPIVLLVEEQRPSPDLLAPFVLVSAYGVMWLIRIFRVKSIYQKNLRNP